MGPARDEGDYQHKAVATTEQVRSSVRTVELATQAAEDDSAFGPYLARVISQAEDDAGSALNGFESIQPPSGASDDLRDEVAELAGDAIDTLAQARIAARRSDRAALVALRDRLRGAGDALEAFGEEHHV